MPRELPEVSSEEERLQSKHNVDGTRAIDASKGSSTAIDMLKEKSEIVELLQANSARITLIPNKCRSKVWERFQLVQVDGAIRPFVACKDCQKVYMHSEGFGSSSLKKHSCLRKRHTKSFALIKEKDEIVELLQENSDRIALVPNDGCSASKAWEKFQHIQVDGDIRPFVACKDCQKVYMYIERNGTTSIRNHSCQPPKKLQARPQPSRLSVDAAKATDDNGSKEVLSSKEKDNMTKEKDEIVKLLWENSARIALVPNDGRSASKAWEKFQHIQLDGDIRPFVACKDCQKVYMYIERNGTTTIRNHSCRPLHKLQARPQPSRLSAGAVKATDDGGSLKENDNIAKKKDEIVELLRENSARIVLILNNSQRNLSNVWEKFHLIEVDGVIQPFAVCKDCQIVLTYTKRDDTSRLVLHSCESLKRVQRQMSVASFASSKPSSAHLMEAKRKITAKVALCAARDLLPYMFLEGPGMRDLAQTLIDIGAEAAERGQRIKVEDVMPSADIIRSEKTKVIFDPSEVRRPVSELPPAKRQKKSAAPSPAAVAPVPAAQGTTTRAAAATPTAAAGAATAPGKRTCQFCRRPGRQEVVLVCRMCKTPAHPSCLGYSRRLARKVQDKPWTCLDCKTCVLCRDGGLLIFCDQCDQAYHMSCHRPAVRRKPSGEWLCSGCQRDTPSAGAPRRRGRPPKLAWKPESPAIAKPSVAAAKPRTFKRHGNAKPTATARPTARTHSPAVPLRFRAPKLAWVSTAAPGGFRGRPVGLVRPSMAAISNLASS